MIEDYVQSAQPRCHPYRSQSEHRIASLLDRYGLPFIYEKPTAVVDRGQVRIWYPDFTLSYGPVIEYFGVNGDAAYAQRTQHKLAVYQQNQIPVVAVYPQDFGAAWEDRLLKRIEGTLERQLRHYQTRIGRGYCHGPSRYRAH
jgi:hypothetical protein